MRNQLAIKWIIQEIAKIARVEDSPKQHQRLAIFTRSFGIAIERDKLWIHVIQSNVRKPAYQEMKLILIVDWTKAYERRGVDVGLLGKSQFARLAMRSRDGNIPFVRVLFNHMSFHLCHVHHAERAMEALEIRHSVAPQMDFN